jgi:hypothetical protein
MHVWMCVLPAYPRQVPGGAGPRARRQVHGLHAATAERDEMKSMAIECVFGTTCPVVVSMPAARRQNGHGTSDNRMASIIAISPKSSPPCCCSDGSRRGLAKVSHAAVRRRWPLASTYLPAAAAAAAAAADQTYQTGVTCASQPRRADCAHVRRRAWRRRRTHCQPRHKTAAGGVVVAYRA